MTRRLTIRAAPRRPARGGHGGGHRLARGEGAPTACARGPCPRPPGRRRARWPRHRPPRRATRAFAPRRACASTTRSTGANSAASRRQEYLALAQALRDRPLGPRVVEAARPDGVVTRFDRDSGAFLAFDPTGRSVSSSSRAMARPTSAASATGRRDDRPRQVRRFLEERGSPPHVVEGGLEGLLRGWEAAVAAVAEGYPLDALDDYLDDLDGRQILDEALAVATQTRGRAAPRAPGRRRRALPRAGHPDRACLWGERAAAARTAGARAGAGGTGAAPAGPALKLSARDRHRRRGAGSRRRRPVIDAAQSRSRRIGRYGCRAISPTTRTRVRRELPGR